MKKICLLLFTAFLLYTSTSMAQNTMIMDVSNVTLEKLIATAKENYPRIKGFASRVNVSKAIVTSAKSQWLDGLSFNYVYKPNNTLDIVNPTFFNGYQVAVSFSVTELFQKGSNVRQAKEGVKIAVFDQEEYNLTLETQVKTRYYAFVNARKQLDLQYQINEDAKNLFEVLKLRYAKGEVSISEFLQAQGAKNSSLQAMNSVETGYLSAKANLEELTVKKIEEIQ